MKYLFAFFLVLFFSCQDDEINPYNDPSLQPPESIDTNYFSNESEISALHYNVFMPYCANSGCHDGNFEPDFRTVESSYSTLVYQPVVKNNDNQTYEYRVVPGNSAQSILYARLLSYENGVSVFDNNSQVMPMDADIVYDPNKNHPWHERKSEMIAEIKQWIDDGAKDMFGNEPSEYNKVPEMLGCIAYVTGQNTPLSRELPRGTIYVPSNANSIDLFFSVLDDNLISNELTYNKVKFSKNLLSFSFQPERSLEVMSTPISGTGFYPSNNIDFFHKFTLDMSVYESGDVVFIKIYLQDDVNSVTEIPTNGSDYQIIKHFSFTVI